MRLFGRRSNCLIFALGNWRWSRVGHWLALRRSLWGPIPHFATWYEQGEMVLKSEYLPADPKPFRILPAPLFHGRIVQTVYRRVDTTEGAHAPAPEG